MFKKSILLVILFTALVCVSAGAHAIPQQINFQGRLASFEGGPISSSTSVNFDLYDDATLSGIHHIGSTINKTITPDQNGMFSVLLDFDSSYFDGGNRWLEITVNGQTLTPRQEFATVPYAYMALTAESLAGGAGSGSVILVNSKGALSGGPITTSGTLEVKYDNLSIDLSGNNSLEVKNGGITSSLLAPNINITTTGSISASGGLSTTNLYATNLYGNGTGISGITATTAAYAMVCGVATNATYSVYAQLSGNATSAASAGYATLSGTASNCTGSVANAIYSQLSGNSTSAASAGYATLSGTASNCTGSVANAIYSQLSGNSTTAASAGYATLSGNATAAASAGYATLSGTASNCTGSVANAIYSQLSGSSTTASYSTLSGTASTCTGTVANATNAIYAQLSGSSTTASYSTLSGTASNCTGTVANATNAVYAQLSGNATSAASAGYATLSGTASTCTGTVANATNALSAGYATLSGTASTLASGANISTTGYITAGSISGKHYGDGSALTGIAATWAATSVYAQLSGSSTTASYSTLSGTASTCTGTVANATNAVYAQLSGNATSAASAGYATLSGTASNCTGTVANATNAVYAQLSGNATSAASSGYSTLSGTASTCTGTVANATNAIYAQLSGSSTTASYSTLSGTASTCTGTVANATNAVYSQLSGSSTTASYSTLSGTASTCTGTVANATNALSAGYATLAGSASSAAYSTLSGTASTLASGANISTTGYITAGSISGKHYGDGSALTGIAATWAATSVYAQLSGSSTTASYSTLSGTASNCTGTVANATNAIYSQLSGSSTTASYSTLSGTASNCTGSVANAIYSQLSGSSTTASYSTLSGTASTCTGTVANATNAIYAQLSGSSTTASYSTLSGTASTCTGTVANATNAVYSQLSGSSTTASYSTLSGTASNCTGTVANATNAIYSQLSGSSTTASYSTLSGTASTCTGTVANATNAIYSQLSGNSTSSASAGYATLSGTASNCTGTVANATNALSAGYATLSGTASTLASGANISTTGYITAGSISGKHYGDGSALTGIAATWAATSVYAQLSGSSTTASYSTLSGTASTCTGTVANATNAVYAQLSGNATSAASAGYATLSGTASNCTGTVANATNAVYSQLSGNSTTASYSTLSGTASTCTGTVANATNALSAGYATLAGSASSAAYSTLSGTASTLASGANISTTGYITAGSISGKHYGDGSNLTGVATSGALNAYVLKSGDTMTGTLTTNATANNGLDVAGNAYLATGSNKKVVVGSYSTQSGQLIINGGAGPSIVAGSSSGGTGSGGVALGASIANGTNSMAVGDTCTANNSDTFAEGFKSYAGYTNDIAMGNSSSTGGNGNSVAIGYFAFAPGAGAIALGYQTSAEASESMAIGANDRAIAGATYSYAIGQGSTAGNSNSMALGFNCNTTGQGAVAIGNTNIASTPFNSTWYSLALGNYSYANMGGFTLGNYCTAEWAGDLAAGVYTRASAQGTGNAMVIGAGYSQANPLLNNTANSFMVGFMNSATDITPEFTVKDGAVGINTITPKAALDVVGTVSIETLGNGIRFPDGSFQTTAGTAGAFSGIYVLKSGDTMSGPLGISASNTGYLLNVNNSGSGGGAYFASAFGPGVTIYGANGPDCLDLTQQNTGTALNISSSGTAISITQNNTSAQPAISIGQYSNGNGINATVVLPSTGTVYTGNENGYGQGMNLAITNGASTREVLYATTNGTGYTGYFTGGKGVYVSPTLEVGSSIKFPDGSFLTTAKNGFTPGSFVRITGDSMTGTLTNSATTGMIVQNNAYLATSSGLVGIGTTTPTAELNVIAGSGALGLQGLYVSKSYSGGGNGVIAAKIVGVDSGVGDTGLYITCKGSGGFGTAGGFILQSVANGSPIMTELNNGNFGILTTNPQAALDVNGSISIETNGNGIRFPDGTFQTTAGGSYTPGSFVRITGDTMTGTLTIGAGGLTVGNNNTAVASSAAIGAGNAASGPYSIAAGTNNTAASSYSFALGYGNSVGNIYSMAMGFDNTASGRGDLLSGQNNTVSGNAACAIGQNNTALSDFGFALGDKAVVSSSNSGTFVWADSQGITFASTAANQFLIRAQNGVGINTNSPNAALDVVGNISIEGGGNGIRFPDGTLQTTAGGGSYVPGSFVMITGDTMTGVLTMNASNVGLNMIGGNAFLNVGQLNTVAPGSAVIGSNNATQWTSMMSALIEGDGNILGPSANDSLAAGSNNMAFANSDIVLGQSNIVSAPATAAIGYGNHATVGADKSFTAGNGNYASASYQVALGYQNSAYGPEDVLIGYQNTSSNSYSAQIAIGASNIVNGNNSMAIGISNSSSGNSSLAMGAKMTVGGNNSVGIGLDNNPHTVSAANVMSIMGGNVGIGTVTPNAALDVVGNISIETLGNGIRFPDGTFQTTAGGGSGAYVQKTGDTMSGALTVNATITANNLKVTGRVTVDSIDVQSTSVSAPSYFYGHGIGIGAPTSGTIGIWPSTDNSFNVGESSLKFADMETYNFHATNFTVDSTGMKLTARATIDSIDVLSTASSAPSYFYGHNIGIGVPPSGGYVGIWPATDGNFSLGETSLKYADIETYDLHARNLTNDSTGIKLTAMTTVSATLDNSESNYTSYFYGQSGVKLVVGAWPTGTGSGGVYPSVDNTLYLGNASYRFGSVYDVNEYPTNIHFPDGSVQTKAYAPLIGIVSVGLGGAGNATVNTTAVTTNCVILLTAQSAEAWAFVSSRIPGTSFTISRETIGVSGSTSIGWMLVN